ncbi:hypothetical protein HNY73_008359 [Argiope bruennichi]|uniref:Uncharacterized protein n=1 Tax=Argiope bruennichi TaxID=94029 RepID=A0A8T0FCL1_ARGBR|nr:hypothetical protein HNY73_008359 [Argiope bruennichi]
MVSINILLIIIGLIQKPFLCKKSLPKKVFCICVVWSLEWIIEKASVYEDQKLTAVIMNQQSDSVDIFGEYKPVKLIFAIQPMKDGFVPFSNINGCAKIFEVP